MASQKNDTTVVAGTDVDDLKAKSIEQIESANAQIPRWIRDATPEELAEKEKRLRRKIDLRLLPMIVVIYIMNYLDRNNIATAGLAGLKEDLQLQGVEFNTAVAILFVGYLLMQVPSNMILNKLGKPSIYLPCCMVVWGTISAATASVRNYAGLVVVRFFLGFVEAAYFPGCLYYLSCWYTRSELALRTGILYSGSLLSGAFGGLIAAGIVDGMDGKRGLAAWKWLFLIEGVVTIAVACSAFFMLPDLPRTTRWLSQEEKELAAWRLQVDIGEDDWIDREHQSMFHGFKLAVLDIKTWLILIIIYGSTASGSMTTFFPTVVKTLGKGNIETLLMTAPPYVIAVIACLTNAWHADKTGERWLHIAVPPLVAMAMYIIAVSTTNFAARYFAMCIMVGGTYSGYVVALGYISNILPRPVAKRAAALAMINSLSNVCQIYSPYMYPSSAAPRFTVAFSVNIAMSAMTVISATAMRIYLGKLNKKLDRGEPVRDVKPDGPDGGRGFRFLL